MPIIDIQIVGEPADATGQELSRRLADAIGVALNARPQGTWVKVQVIPIACYAENGAQHGPSHVAVPAPVFVSVLQKRVPGGDALRTQTAALTTAIAEVCARPAENVHVIYQPDGAGRVAFGGVLIE